MIYFFADEKKQYDPAGFRDAILEGLNEAGSDLDSVSKFLDAQSSKLDYRRYGVTLIEILIAGGLLGNYYGHFKKALNRPGCSNLPPNLCSVPHTAPGGILIQEGGENACQTETCLFGQAMDSMEMVKAWEQVFVRLVWR